MSNKKHYKTLINQQLNTLKSNNHQIRNIRLTVHHSYLPFITFQELFLRFVYFVLISCVYLLKQTKKKNMETKGIKTLRELAIKLSTGKVSVDLIPKKAQKRVSLWLSRNEVILEDGFLRLSKVR